MSRRRQSRKRDGELLPQNRPHGRISSGRRSSSVGPSQRRVGLELSVSLPTGLEYTSGQDGSAPSGSRAGPGRSSRSSQLANLETRQLMSLSGWHTGARYEVTKKSKNNDSLPCFTNRKSQKTRIFILRYY
jgi:hypothetical protein